jgi:hypothetical protein
VGSLLVSKVHAIQLNGYRQASGPTHTTHTTTTRIGMGVHGSKSEPLKVTPETLSAEAQKVGGVQGWEGGEGKLLVLVLVQQGEGHVHKPHAKANTVIPWG